MAKYIPIGDPINAWESEAMRLLRDRLPDHFLVLGNFELQLPQRANTFEYDAVVVGEHGLYAVEIKGWSGTVEGDQRRWYLDWGKVQNPFILTERKAKAMRSFIRLAVPELPRDIFCQAVVMLPAGADVRVEDVRAERILQPHTFYDFFVNEERILAIGPGALLNERLRRKIEEALVPLAAPPSEVPRVPNYEIVGEPDESEAQTRPYREFVGKHALLRSRERVRIKMYSLDPLATDAEQRRAYDRVLRDMEALTRLHANPYIASAYEVLRDNDHELNFFLVSEWVGTRTLQDFIESAGSGWEACRKAKHLGAHLLRAVKFMHEQGIVHRNLNPGVIYLTEEGGAVPLKIADFDYARVVQLPSISDALDHNSNARYKAPELWRSNDYDHRVDLFSCGAILFELCTGQRLFESVGDLLVHERVWERKKELLEDPECQRVLGGLLSTEPDVREAMLQDAIDYFGEG